MNAPASIDMTYDMDSRYLRRSGRIFLSGTQALVRLPMLQRELDRAAGLNTGGFISGYRGSPLGAYDKMLSDARHLLTEHNIFFQPGLNEDLAATSVWGSQQIGLWPGANVDGAFGIWYGKGPGVDRSMDVFKHANAAGAAKHGGVLALVGDDHGCQSSTLAHQSEQVLIAAMMPVLNPASVQEYFYFGLAGFALSRFSGCWVGFKAISETVECSASLDLDAMQLDIAIPEDFQMPPGGLNIRWPDPPLEMERRLHGPRMDAVQAFARANRLDEIIWSSSRDRIGIISTGKSYLDVLQALQALDIDGERARALGIRLYKVGLTWPLEESYARAFADGLEEVIVVEEKMGVIEDQLVRILYNQSAKPRIVGKKDEQGRPLVQSTGELTPVQIAGILANRLRGTLGADAAHLVPRNLAPIDGASLHSTSVSKLQRAPFFCSGCPHNISTKVPDGSRAMAGIGCHGMSIWTPIPRAETVSQMGGEGANWIGQAPFSGDTHVFQNLGDGTYFHSGLLAIRAAAAAGVNITYKILFNDAVAMTGGQNHDGTLTVPLITQQVAAEGARKIVVVTDEPEKYGGAVGLAPGVTVRPREALDAVQKELRDIPGLTILIYDQTCAAEKRRRRKRGLYPDPPKRAFINSAVCEGCGDCSEKASCVSIAPLETQFGRKRQIDQSSCNKDFSCIEGFCPSFVTVKGGRLRVNAPAGLEMDSLHRLDDIEPPALDGTFRILITGIGGTGVVTIGAILGMAAHLENKGSSVLDFAGLAQKNGAVMSHVHLSPSPTGLLAARIDRQGADLVIGCDMVVATSADAIDKIRADGTAVVLNSHVQPTADFVYDRDLSFGTAEMQEEILRKAGKANTSIIDATNIAIDRFGDAIAANLFMLGFAWQRRLVPLKLESLMRAIELNNVAVKMNKSAFEWGRYVAQFPDLVTDSVGDRNPIAEDTLSVQGVIERNYNFLVNYQNNKYAENYRGEVENILDKIRRKFIQAEDIEIEIANNLFKLMSYKDEYEVARLYSDPEFKKDILRTFEGDFSLEFHLAPPILGWLKDQSGKPRKIRFGPWMLPAMRLLARFKGLRGTRFDPFGMTRERRIERQLIADYVQTMHAVIERSQAHDFDKVMEIARSPQHIRGYGHVKMKGIENARGSVRDAMAYVEASGEETRLRTY